MRKLTILLLTLTFAFTSATYAQRRTVQNKPYIDYRKFHYGFLFGVQCIRKVYRSRIMVTSNLPPASNGMPKTAA